MCHIHASILFIGIKYNIITLSKIDIFHYMKKKYCLRLVGVNIAENEAESTQDNIIVKFDEKAYTNRRCCPTYYNIKVSHIFLLVLSILIPKISISSQIHTMKGKYQLENHVINESNPYNST